MKVYTIASRIVILCEKYSLVESIISRLNSWMLPGVLQSLTDIDKPLDTESTFINVSAGDFSLAEFA